MESGKLVEITDTHGKIRRKVKEHGSIWRLVYEDLEICYLETIKPVHHGGHPYGIWVMKSDCTLKEVTDEKDKEK
jgi:hypothetical protein